MNQVNIKKEIKMKYEVKKSILGFEDIKEVELVEVDEVFARIEAVGKDISLALVNPYSLREYSFDVPKAVQVLLDMNENTKLLVYTTIAVKDDSKESLINFKAPIIFNQDNQTCAQIVLSEKEGVARLGDFLDK